MKGKVAAAATLAVATTFAALAASTVASAAADARSGVDEERIGPLTLDVICVELLADAPKVKDKLWRVHFGYSTTAGVDPKQVRKSEFEDAPGWNVVSGTPPGSFASSGFDATDGQTVVAIVAENDPGSGRESITWDVDLVGPHAYGPKKARFDGDTMGASACPGGSAADEVVVPQEPVRAIYCSVAGNAVNGVPVPPGTALNLYLGQPGFDPSYKGATPAFFLEGIGATCDPPMAGYTFQSSTYVDGAGQAHGLENAIYPFYAKP